MNLLKLNSYESPTITNANESILSITLTLTLSHSLSIFVSFSCVSARDGVTWMMKYRQLKEREHAVKILRRLLKKGLIIPLNPNQTEFTDNTTDFYYFLVRVLKLLHIQLLSLRSQNFRIKQVRSVRNRVLVMKEE
jgi:hypothetical protein